MMLILIVMVMIMIVTRILSRHDRLRFKRRKSGSIRILFRQSDKYHYHGLRIDLKLAAALQHIML